jgi:hypothetical protein
LGVGGGKLSLRMAQPGRIGTTSGSGSSFSDGPLVDIPENYGKTIYKRLKT